MMERFTINKRRALLGFYLVLLCTSSNIQAQSIKRQCLSSYGTTVTAGNVVFMQTIGQPYSTIAFYDNTGSITQGFQQPVVFKIESINNLLRKNLNINVFPNPAAYSITIRSGELIENSTIQVTDLNGKLIINTQVPKLQTHEVNCSAWKNGIYIITVSDKNQNKSTLKLIINK